MDGSRPHLRSAGGSLLLSALFSCQEKPLDDPLLLFSIVLASKYNQVEPSRQICFIRYTDFFAFPFLKCVVEISSLTIPRLALVLMGISCSIINTWNLFWVISLLLSFQILAFLIPLGTLLGSYLFLMKITPIKSQNRPYPGCLLKEALISLSP